jgi:hypothetical protein
MMRKGRNRPRWLALGLVCGAAALGAPGRADAPPGRYEAADGESLVRDRETGLVWETTSDEAGYTWEEAKALCAGRAGGAARLPTMKELLTLVDESRTDPAIDPAAFPGSTGYYWSSTVYAPNDALAWLVDFTVGAPSWADQAGAARVRCVR